MMSWISRCARWAFAALVSATAVAGGVLSAEENSMVGQVAPDFEIKEWINGTDKTSLKSCQGQVVLIELWATT